MKYICWDCGKEFDEPAENKKVESKLVRSSILKCVHCKGNMFELSEHGKLLVERKAKIDKIENTQS